MSWYLGELFLLVLLFLLTGFVIGLLLRRLQARRVATAKHRRRGRR